MRTHLSYSTVAAMRRLRVGLEELEEDEFDVPEEDARDDGEQSAAGSAED